MSSKNDGQLYDFQVWFMWFDRKDSELELDSCSSCRDFCQVAFLTQFPGYLQFFYSRYINIGDKLLAPLEVP